MQFTVILQELHAVSTVAQVHSLAFCCIRMSTALLQYNTVCSEPRPGRTPASACEEVHRCIRRAECFSVAARTHPWPIAAMMATAVGA